MNGYVMYNYAYVFLPNVTLEFLLAILVERRSAGFKGGNSSSYFAIQ